MGREGVKRPCRPCEERGRKVILVTGASSGIGRAVAVQFGEQHDRVALVARRKDLLQEVAEEIEHLGGEPLVVAADVTEREQVESAVRAVEDRWGRIDVLINNAGYGVFGGVDECSTEDFEHQMNVNYMAAVYAVKATMPLMRRQGTGAVINVSSISGKGASPYDAGYCASKSALNAFTSALRMELAGTGISVSLVCPGYTSTGWEEAMGKRHRYVVRTRLRAMTAERVARAIVACAERPKREVVIPWALNLLVFLQLLCPSAYERWQIRTKRK